MRTWPWPWPCVTAYACTAAAQRGIAGPDSTQHSSTAVHTIVQHSCMPRPPDQTPRCRAPPVVLGPDSTQHSSTAVHTTVLVQHSCMPRPPDQTPRCRAPPVVNPACAASSCVASRHAQLPWTLCCRSGPKISIEEAAAARCRRSFPQYSL